MFSRFKGSIIRGRMIRLFGHYIPKSLFALGIVEVVIVAASIFGATHVRYLLADLEPPAWSTQLPEKLTFVVVVYLVMLSVGLYRRETCRDPKMTISRLIVAVILAFIAMSVIFYVFPDVAIWRSIFAIAFPFMLVGILVARAVFGALAGREAFKRRVLVLGAGLRAVKIREMAASAEHNDFTIVDFVRTGATEQGIADARNLADIGDLRAFARKLGASEIVTAIEERRGNLPVEHLLGCKFAGIAIRDYTTFLERETGVVDLDTLNPSWIVYSDDGGRSRLDYLGKRLFDIAVSLVLLVFTLPILLATAAAVKLTSRGPVFYRQERIGAGGEPFMLLKFRSMYEGAEANDTPQWAIEDDPRVTPVGRLIRLTRMDEIPQIFNVLRGDMSFVGPRPERPYFVNALTRDLPYYAERHAVKPGITGWAQLNYPYGASVADAKQKLQYDLYYIKNYSIFLDLLILIQTARVILFPTGLGR